MKPRLGKIWHDVSLSSKDGKSKVRIRIDTRGILSITKSGFTWVHTNLNFKNYTKNIPVIDTYVQKRKK